MIKHDKELFDRTRPQTLTKTAWKWFVIENYYRVHERSNLQNLYKNLLETAPNLL